MNACHSVRLLAGLALILPVPAGAEPPRATPVGRSLYEKVVAVCVGIDADCSPMTSNLACAERDATAMSRLFRERYGYETELLVGSKATKAAIHDAAIRHMNLSDQSALIFYFAGHGATCRPNHQARESGFLIPYDAKLDAGAQNDLARYTREAINMSEFSGRLRDTGMMHVVLLLDCCFSGFAGQPLGLGPGEARDSINPYLIRTRRVITAGTAGQQSWEDPESGHGYFTNALLTTLDVTHPVDTRTLWAALGDVTPRVRATKGAGLFPQLRDLIQSDGDFLFQPIGTQVAVAATGSPRPTGAPRGVPSSEVDRVFRDTPPTAGGLSEVPVGEQPKFDSMLRSASEGDPNAMAIVSRMYARGMGTPRDDAAAFRWAQESYNTNGDADAGKLALADCYENGRGVQRDPGKAGDFYRSLRVAPSGRRVAQSSSASSVSSVAPNLRIPYLPGGSRSIVGKLIHAWEDSKSLRHDAKDVFDQANKVRSLIVAGDMGRKLEKELRELSKQIGQVRERHSGLFEDPRALREYCDNLTHRVEEIERHRSANNKGSAKAEFDRLENDLDELQKAVRASGG